MDVHYPTIDEPAVPEYVMAVLQDMHRQQCQSDPEADPGAVLSLDTTITEWRDACDLLGSKKLGRAHNEFWGISCSDAEWHAVLEPAGQKRLSGVCQLVAERTVRPVIRPARLFGSNCAPAGAFLTIRSLLHQAGEQVDDIAPSTPLASYARRHAAVFLGPVSRLSPGSLPPVRIRTPIYDAVVWSLLVALLCLLIGACSGLHLLSIAAVLLFATAYALTWSARCLLITKRWTTSSSSLSRRSIGCWSRN